jgi:hypothetical protein
MRIFTLTFFFAALLVFSSKSQPNYSIDSTTMGASYAYDVYYSLSQGTAATVLRANWDLAFRAYPTSASILVNDGAGSSLWAYPNGNYSAWSTVDTAGISSWTVLYNSDSSWEEGAFNANSLGHPDYGWGSYNSVTHNVVGDSIFILKTFNGPFKKVAILSKQSLAMIYTFRIANLDGSGDTTVVLNAAPYNTKNFVYFDASTNAILDREPVSADWDILFSRYYAELNPDVFYPVVGVLHNYNVSSARYAMADSSSLYWDFPDFKDDRSNIGHTWKAINMTTFQWDIDDSLYFVIKDVSGNLYKLVFNSFTGTGTGKARFRKAMISGVGIDEGNPLSLNAYPVPSDGELNIEIPAEFRNAMIHVYDMSGRLVFMTQAADSGVQRIDLGSLSSGVYSIRLFNDRKSLNSRIIRN